MKNCRIVDQVSKLWGLPSSWEGWRNNETRLRFKSPITSQQPISHNEPNLWRLEGRNHWLCPSTQIFSTGAPTVVFFSLLLLHGKYESEPRDLNIFYIPIKEDIGRFRHQISPPTFYPFFTLRTKLSIWSPFLLFSTANEIFLFDFQPPQGVGVSGRRPLRGIITLITLGCANGNCGGAPPPI